MYIFNILTFITKIREDILYYQVIMSVDTSMVNDQKINTGIYYIMMDRCIIKNLYF